MRRGTQTARRILATGTFSATIALGIGMTAARASESDRALIAHACWSHERFYERDIGGAIAGKWFFSLLICFQTRGAVVGSTFDAHDGWDWSQRYEIVDRTIFIDGEVFGRILDVDQRRFTVVREDGGQRTYRLVCRTEAEDVQCERLRQRSVRFPLR